MSLTHRPSVPGGRSSETSRGKINLVEIFGRSPHRGTTKAALREAAAAAHREFQPVLEARRQRRLMKMQAAEAALSGGAR